MESKPKILKALMRVMMPIECFCSVAAVTCPVFILVVLVFGVLIPLVLGNLSGVLESVLVTLTMLIVSGFLFISGLAAAWLHTEDGLPRWAQPALAFTLAGVLLLQALHEMLFAAADAFQVPVTSLEWSASLVIAGILFVRRVPQRLLGTGRSQ